MFNEDFRHGRTFNFDGSSNPYITLNNWVADKHPDRFIVRGVFTHNKSAYGEKGVIVTDGFNIDVPEHLIKDIKKILANDMYIEAINQGKCAFLCSSYIDKNGITRNSGNFIDN